MRGGHYAEDGERVNILEDFYPDGRGNRLGGGGFSNETTGGPSWRRWIQQRDDGGTVLAEVDSATR